MSEPTYCETCGNRCFSENENEHGSGKWINDGYGSFSGNGFWVCDDCLGGFVELEDIVDNGWSCWNSRERYVEEI